MSKTIHVINLVRGVGPTSMPWNDLYHNTRKYAPGMAHTPIAITSVFGGLYLRWEKCNGILRRYIDSSMFLALFRIVKIYKKTRDRKRTLAVHIHNPSLAILCLLVKILCPNVVVIVNLHNDWRYFHVHQRISLWILVKLADHLITVSNAIIATIPRSVLKGLKRNKLTAIPNGIRSDILRTIERTNSSDNTAVVIARMVPQKNCFFILKLLAQTPSIKSLIWVGTGVEKSAILNESKRLGIFDRLEFKGVIPRKQVYELLSKSSIYIAASRWEGIGVANIEAAALGCWPYLSSIEPHNEIARELCLDTYPLDNLNTWGSAIETFFTLSDVELELMRDSLVKKTLDKYDLNKAVIKYIEIYKRYSC
jgi:glycosyltransferase involved in cell wall biosynthesis